MGEMRKTLTLGGSLGLTVLAAGMTVGLGFGTAIADEGAYHFSPSGHTDRLNLFRVHRTTGAVDLCDWKAAGEGEPAAGTISCSKQGPGAQAQADGDYVLVPAVDQDSNTIFRVNRATGSVALCYVIDSASDTVDCALEP